MYYLHPLFIMCVQNAKIKIFPLEQKLENPRKKKIKNEIDNDTVPRSLPTPFSKSDLFKRSKKILRKKSVKTKKVVAKKNESLSLLLLNRKPNLKKCMMTLKS